MSFETLERHKKPRYGRRTIAALTAAALSFPLASCTPGMGMPGSRDKDKSISREFDPNYTIEQAVAAYQKLGITKDVKAGYFTGAGLTTDQLQEDLQTRVTTINISKASPYSEHLEGEHTPHNVIANYSAKTDGLDLYLPEWKVKGPALEGLLSNEALPLARVSLGKDKSLQLTDLRPPLERFDETYSEDFESFRDKFVQPTSAFMQEALQTGAVKEYLFVYSTDDEEIEAEFGTDSAYYLPRTKQAVIVLPKTASTPYQTLDQTVTHETAHGYFKEAPVADGNKEKTPTQELKTLRNACRNIKEAAFNEAYSSFEELMPLLKRYKKLVPERADDIDTIMQAFDDGTLIDLQYDSMFANRRSEVPECAVTNPNEMLGYLASIAETPPKEAGKLSDKEYDLIIKINSTFFNAYRSTMVAQGLAEYGYIEDEKVGHPEDGIDELAASLFTIAREYPEDFQRHVSYLLYDEQEAVIKAYNTIRKAFIAANPNLRDDLPKIKFF